VELRNICVRLGSGHHVTVAALIFPQSLLPGGVAARIVLGPSDRQSDQPADARVQPKD
jgi:hypothetical protein